MYIQYVGFALSSASRLFTFHVIDGGGEIRTFSVAVPSDMFLSNGLKPQDGPGMCYAHLKQVLEREPSMSRAEAHLSIEARDVQDYLEKRYPRKYPVKKDLGAEI